MFYVILKTENVEQIIDEVFRLTGFNFCSYWLKKLSLKWKEWHMISFLFFFAVRKQFIIAY